MDDEKTLYDAYQPRQSFPGTTPVPPVQSYDQNSVTIPLAPAGDPGTPTIPLVSPGSQGAPQPSYGSQGASQPPYAPSYGGQGASQSPYAPSYGSQGAPQSPYAPSYGGQGAPQSPYAPSYGSRGASQPPYAQPHAPGTPPARPAQKPGTILVAVIAVAAVAVIAVVVLAVTGVLGGGKEKNDAAKTQETTAAAADNKEEGSTGDNARTGNSYTYQGVKIPLPENFVTEKQDSSMVAHADSFPNPPDFIVFGMETTSDFDFSEYDSATLSEVKDAFQEFLRNDEDEDWSGATVDSVSRKTVNGKLVYVIKVSDVALGGVPCEVTWVRIRLSAKRAVQLVYTGYTGEFDDEFEESIANISIE